MSICVIVLVIVKNGTVCFDQAKKAHCKMKSRPQNNSNVISHPELKYVSRAFFYFWSLASSSLGRVSFFFVLAACVDIKAVRLFGNHCSKTVYKTQSYSFWQIINCDCHWRAVLLTASQLAQRSTVDSSGPLNPTMNSSLTHP